MCSAVSAPTIAGQPSSSSDCASDEVQPSLTVSVSIASPMPSGSRPSEKGTLRDGLTFFFLAAIDRLAPSPKTLRKRR